MHSSPWVRTLSTAGRDELGRQTDLFDFDVDDQQVRNVADVTTAAAAEGVE